MPKPVAPNVLNNPLMALWDYGTGINLSAIGNGYSATRWKTVLAGAPSGSVGQVTADSSATFPKWLRSQPCMSIAITDLPAGSNVSIRQQVENGFLFSRSFAALTVVAEGLAGASFDVAVGSEVATVETKGDGVLVTAVNTFFLPDLATNALPVDIFTNPSTWGTFTLHAACLTIGDGDVAKAGISLPDAQTDRRLCNRYCQPLSGGLSGAAASGSSLPLPVRYLVPMRTNPTLLAPASSLTALAMLDGASVANAAPTLALGGVSANAARLATTGWSGLVAGNTYMVSTPTLGLLHADY